MRVAFLTASAPGHGYPMTTLARRLKARGRDVVSIGFPSAEPLVRAAELPFVPIGEKEYPAGSDREILNQLSKLQGQEALAWIAHKFGDICCENTRRQNAFRVLRAGKGPSLHLELIVRLAQASTPDRFGSNPLSKYASTNQGRPNERRFFVSIRCRFGLTR